MRQFQDTHKAFIALVRLGIGHSSDWLSDAIYWKTVREIAEEQGLSAIVLDGIEKAKNKSER